GGGNYNNTAFADADNANLVSDDALLNVGNITGSLTVATECNKYFWQVNDQYYTASEYLILESVNNSGCIQKDTLDLTIHYSDETSFSATACESYTWDGTTYTSSGSFTKDYTNIYGCDSTSTLHLTINEETSSYQEATACDSYEWKGTVYTEGGIKTSTSTNDAGCIHT